MKQGFDLSAVGAVGEPRSDLDLGIPYDPEVADAHLPFRIRVASNEEMVRKAVKIRQSAYARHVPEFAATMSDPEDYDFLPGAVVLIAESRLDDEPLGTMRIQTNRHHPLALEQSLALPAPFLDAHLATAARLGVVQGRMGTAVKTALFKAFYEYCLLQRVRWMVIAARRPLDRQYGALLFTDIYPERGFVPLAHAQGIPHRVLALEVAAVKRSWAAANHPLYDYFFKTLHRDIQVIPPPESGSTGVSATPSSVLHA